jgi:hypothetical protein
MKSTDVISAYVNTRSDPTTKVKIVDVGDSGSCRLFSVVWVPYSVATGNTPGIEIWSGDPDSGGSEIYQDSINVGGGYIGGAFTGSQKYVNYYEFPLNYILSDKDLYVKGINQGINNVTITYQLGG